MTPPDDQDGTLAQLRDELPPGEIGDLEAIVAEVQEATSSPRALKRWERKLAREQAEQDALLRVVQQMRPGSPPPDADPDPWS